MNDTSNPELHEGDATRLEPAHASKTPTSNEPTAAGHASHSVEPTATQMNFKGSPSQWVNTPTVIQALIVFIGIMWCKSLFPLPQAIAAAPILFMVALVLYRFLITSTTIYTVDPERIHVRRGILVKKVESLELFRVQDVVFVQPWWQGMAGIGVVIVDSSDLEVGKLRLVGINDGQAFRDNLNKASIALRQAKGIHEVNYGRV